MEFGRKLLQRVRGNSQEEENDENPQDVEPAWDFLDDQFALEEFENLRQSPRQNLPQESRSIWYTNTNNKEKNSDSSTKQKETEGEKSFFRDMWRRYKPRNFNSDEESADSSKLKQQHRPVRHRLSPRSSPRSRSPKAKAEKTRLDLSRSNSADSGTETALELNQSGSWKEDADKIKGKLKAAWNNVRYGWTIKHRSSFDEESPIWLLGKLYDARIDSDDRFMNGKLTEADLLNSSDFHDFIADFTSRIWLTYRTGFENLPGSQIYSDTGWGCMLRTGQMLLAQALVLHLLGRDWTVFDAQTYDTCRAHKDIIRYFGDSPSCPLSLHNMVHFGTADHGKTLGDWYGPGSTAFVLRDIMRSPGAQAEPILRQLAVYVAQDNTVCLEEIEKLCADSRDDHGLESRISVEDVQLVRTSSVDTAEQGTDAGAFVDDVTFPQTWNKSLIVLVPLRLGTEHLNPLYVQHLRMVLAMRHCLGIIGGRPKHSMYFVGWHSHYWIYLDPHYCQDFTDSSLPEFSIKSYHCRWPRKLDIEDMDPSCAVGFYCRNREALDRLLEDLAPVIENSQFPHSLDLAQESGSPVRFPLFSVVKSRASSLQYKVSDATSAANRRFPERYRMDHIEQQRLAKVADSHGFELL